MDELRRDLKMATPAGTRTIPVIMQQPVSRKEFWSVSYAIGWPEGVKNGEARGADAIQALYLAMEGIAVDIYSSKHHLSGNLYWQKRGQGYFFPMPKVGRDQLVGADRELQT